MVVERGSLSAINFLLAQGAAPKNYIREEYSAIVTHTLFRQHTTYQLKKIWREMSSACRQKFRQEFLTKQSFFDRFITAAKEEKKTTSLEGINPKDIGMRVDRYDRDQTLFHILTCDNRHDVLTEIKRNIGNGTHMNKKL